MAGATLGEIQMSLFVTGAIFGEVGVVGGEDRIKI